MIYVYLRTLEVAPNVLERRTLEVALGAENVRAFIYSHVYNELLIRTLSLGFVCCFLWLGSVVRKIFR